MRAGKAAKAAKGDRQTVVSAVWSTVEELALKCKVRRRYMKRSKLSSMASTKLLATGQMGPGVPINSLMRLARKSGRRMTLPPRLCLSIANVLDVAANAAQHEVSRKTARRVAGAVAHITLRLQALRLNSLMHYLESRPPPD